MPTILITGANRGLGLEFVKQYSHDGWHVIATCRHPEKALELKKLQQKSAIDIYPLELANIEQINELARQLNNTPIDILLHNAAIFGPNDAFVGNINSHELFDAFAINTVAPLLLTQAVIENVLASEKKMIVAITSGYASISETTTSGHYPYAISKVGLNMMMKTLAVEFSDKNIISVVLNPGWVRTDMGGPNAPLSAEQVVNSLKTLMGKLTMVDNGKFLSYRGNEISW